MLCAIDEQQLLRVWPVISCLQHIRALHDPETQAEIRTKVQLLSTAFILDLQSLDGERTGFSTPSANPEQMAKLVD